MRTRRGEEFDPADSEFQSLVYRNAQKRNLQTCNFLAAPAFSRRMRRTMGGHVGAGENEGGYQDRLGSREDLPGSSFTRRNFSWRRWRPQEKFRRVKGHSQSASCK